jgi:small subunit ribosomal protein S3
LTTYGLIGVKVWVFKGEILNRQEQAATVSTDAALDEQRRPRRAPRPGDPLPTGRRAW